jgi:hypothetical protein
MSPWQMEPSDEAAFEQELTQPSIGTTELQIDADTSNAHQYDQNRCPTEYTETEVGAGDSSADSVPSTNEWMPDAESDLDTDRDCWDRELDDGAAMQVETKPAVQQQSQSSSPTSSSTPTHDPNPGPSATVVHLDNIHAPDETSLEQAEDNVIHYVA